MRVPPTNESRRRTLGLRVWLIGAVVLIIILLASLRGLAGFYTNYLWFHEVGFSADVARADRAPSSCPTIVFTRLLLRVDAREPRSSPTGSRRGRARWARKTRSSSATARTSRRTPAACAFAISAFFAFDRRQRRLVAVVGVDPLPQPRLVPPEATRSSTSDIGFYVFQLPFLRFVSQWLFVTLRARAARHRGVPLHERRHPAADAVPAGDAAGEGAPLGDPRADGVHEDRGSTSSPASSSCSRPAAPSTARPTPT